MSQLILVQSSRLKGHVRLLPEEGAEWYLVVDDNDGFQQRCVEAMTREARRAALTPHPTPKEPT